MSDSKPSNSDLAQLVKLHNEAVKALTDSAYNLNNEESPEAVAELMHYITRSVWCDRHYNPANVSGILNISDLASLAEVKQALTGLARSERFCTGAWLDCIENQRMVRLIERAKTLLESEADALNSE